MSKTIQYIELVVAAVGMCLGQILMKKGMSQLGDLSFNWNGITGLVSGIFTNPILFFGCFVGGLTTLLWLVMLSHMELSYALPVLNAIYFVLVLFISLIFLHEHVTLSRWIGTGLIAAGMLFVSRGG